MPFVNLTPEEMEQNAVLAEEVFYSMIKDDDFYKQMLLLKKFWKNQLMLCGHKRLGRIIMNLAEDL